MSAIGIGSWSWHQIPRNNLYIRSGHDTRAILLTNKLSQAVVIIENIQALRTSFLVRLGLLEDLLDVGVCGEFVLQ